MRMWTYTLFMFIANGFLASSLPQASSGPITDCSTEVSACEQRYQSSVQNAGSDIAATCLASKTLMDCLNQRENVPQCKSSKAQIDQIKQTYADQIGSTVCASTGAIACAQGAADCSKGYSQQSQNANPSDVCKVANTYITCLNGINCTSATDLLQIGKAINTVTGVIKAGGTSCTLVASVYSAATDCNADVMQCQKTFETQANATGSDIVASCKVAQTFLACLDTKDNAPECSSVKPVIASLRGQYTSQIKALGCKTTNPGSGPKQCMADIMSCQQQFLVDNTKAGTDKTKACQAGEVLGNCLDGIESRPECGGAKKVIDSLRGSYHDQINTQGCAAILLPEQTQCQKDIVACQQTFETTVQGAPNNAVLQCNAGAVFMKCLDGYDHRVECLSAQSAISAMRAIFSKQIADAGCGTAAKPTITPCQGEVMQCVKTFTDSVKIATTVDAKCSAGAALTKCFDDKDKAPECAAVKGIIGSLRGQFASQITSAGCAGNVDPNDPKIKCSLDLTDCEENFQTQVNDAGTDIKAQCLAGSTLESCLGGMETNPDCSSSKAKVDAMKNIYKQQIDQTMCGSTAAQNCAMGVQTCSDTFHTKFSGQTTDKGRCTVSNSYINCLNGVKCSKSFKQQLTTAALMVKMDLSNNTAPCDLADLKVGGGGGASSVTVSVATFVMSFAAVLYAKLLM